MRAGRRTHLLLLLCTLTVGVAPLCAAPAYAHDPFVARDGDTYFLFATGMGIPSQRSRDLIHWQVVGPVFPKVPSWASAAVPAFNGQVWAPEVLRVADGWRLYYSISSFGSNRSVIGLATSPTLDPADPGYRWTDEGMVVQSVPGRDDWNAIDPSPTIDADGRTWLVFGSFWTGIKLIELDPATGKPISSPPLVMSVAARPSVPDHAIEAPFILQEAGHYYLFVSFDHCCRGMRSDYRVAVGRADRITGPYIDRAGVPMMEGGGTVILAGSGYVHGPGHASLLRNGESLRLVHHMYDGRRAGIAVLQVRPVTWTPDGWPAIGDALGE
jgi:arabinan endo-1,5-alpha-L-arabinosidase